MYFNSTLTDSSKLLKPLLVFSFIICAIICGLTRIIQYKNHAIDVYLGFLLGGAIAVYLGLYAVGNFQPSEESSSCLPPLLHRPPCSLPHISQEAVLHHLQMKASMEGGPGLPTSHSEGLLHRSLQQQRPDDAMKHPDVETISARGPPSKDAMVTFSHTLPRVHTPQAMAAYEEAARRHAATLHHASMDSSRSKQLLSQWKSKNNHKCSLTVPDSFSSSGDSSSSHPPPPPWQHGAALQFRASSRGTERRLRRLHVQTGHRCQHHPAQQLQRHHGGGQDLHAVQTRVLAAGPHPRGGSRELRRDLPQDRRGRRRERWGVDGEQCGSGKLAASSGEDGVVPDNRQRAELAAPDHAGHRHVQAAGAAADALQEPRREQHQLQRCCRLPGRCPLQGPQ
ncbi:hypothetical protein INR49_006986 [Caranx melampygus]|nr:hypothetical protein INR49_006986 [Caranx melampygus]